MDRAERMEKDGLTKEPIEFYGKNCEYNFFSNFSPHHLTLPHPFHPDEAIQYMTGEHRFQAMKASNEEDHDWIAAAVTPGDSKTRGRAIELREGWDTGLSYYVMVETVMAKALAHEHILKALLGTNRRAIWEDSPTDDIWGIRYRNDYRGQNLLGKAWMQVRDQIFLIVEEVTEITLDKPQ